MSSAAPDSAITQDDHGAARGCLHPLVREFLDVRHADCMELMAEFPDKHFDLAIVDPPYGIGVDGRNLIANPSDADNKGMLARDHSWDAAPPSAEYFAELRRVSKEQIIWGGNYFLDHLGYCKAPIIWDKLNGDSMYADGELAWTSRGLPKNLKIWKHQWCGAFKDSERGVKRQHPTQKPVALYNWLLAKYAKPGQRILDTHMGSGSIAIAAHYARLHLTACEIDADYFREACARITRETAQDTFDFPNAFITIALGLAVDHLATFFAATHPDSPPPAHHTPSEP